MTIAHGTEYGNNFEAISDVLRRNDFLQLQRGAEIGVRNGIFSEYLLTEHPELTLYLVDPYAPYQDVGHYYNAQEQYEIWCDASDRLQDFEQRIYWVRSPSVEAARGLANPTLDFVFIDAEHSTESVLADIHAWAPIVRPDGLLCGHDYHMPPVRAAVDSAAYMLALQVEPISAPADVWMIRMPGGRR